jgi:hypothetical protein
MRDESGNRSRVECFLSSLIPHPSSLIVVPAEKGFAAYAL